MNQTEISGLEFTGLQFPEMNQDLSHKTEFDVVMATTAMHSGSGNSYACLDGYEDTRMMSGIQAVKEVRHGSTQHLEGTYSDSDEENLSSSPETSSTTNYGYMEQNLENMYNALGEMVDKEGTVVLKPDFVMCDTALHLQPHLIFSPDGFKIEHSDCDPYEDDKTIALCWDVCDIISINSQWTQSVISASVTLLIRPSAETESSDPIRVEFILTDPQWPRKQEKICHMASRYRDIWNNTPSEDFALENRSIDPSLFFPKQYFSGIDDFEDVIYPKGDPDAVSISSRDVDLLLPETFVNDTIIDFYIKYLRTRMKTTEKSKYHFFNSFFFRKLADLDKDQGRAPEGRSAFLRVRKWTRKINIFAKDFLFIPVNFSLHWSLIVICYPGEVETSEDGEAKKHGKVPCILHMDSLKGNHSGLKDIIQSYLWEEWKERHPESALDISDKFLNLRFVSLELPQQDNSFDCGLFLLHYVERFLMDYPSSFNPLKISVSSTFLSDGWFEPAEASLKRSLIRKLIQELVTVPSQTFPELTCGSEQFDESYLVSENAEHEAAREFLAQGCSAGEPDSVCQIPGTQQQSTSICFNDSGNVLPVSGCILETEGVTTFAVLDTQVCPPNNDIAVCMPSQAVENEPSPADYDNKPDLRSCAPEDAEALKDDGCVVKGQDTCEESMLDCLHNNQTISSNAEVTMHDIMDSKCGSFSDNSEAMAYKEHSLGTNINEVLDDCCDVSEDMHPVMTSDAREVDIAPDPASTKDEADNARCDLPDVTGPVAAGDIEGNTSEHFSERNIVEAEEAKGDISEDTSPLVVCDLNNDVAEQSSPVVCDLNNDVAEHSPPTIAVESEDAKHEDTSVDLKVEDNITVGTEETCAAADKINGGEQHISPESIEGNIDSCAISDSAVPHESKEGETSTIVAGDSKNESDEAHVDSVDAHGNVGPGAGETVPCEVDTNHTDAEMPDVDSALCVNVTVCEDKPNEAVCEGKPNEAAVCEDTPCDAKRPLPDSISEDQKIEVCEDKPNEAVCEDKPRDAKRPLLASTSEDQKMEVSEDKPNEAVFEDKPCDAKRPLLASTSEDQKMEVSEREENPQPPTHPKGRETLSGPDHSQSPFRQPQHQLEEQQEQDHHLLLHSKEMQMEENDASSVTKDKEEQPQQDLLLHHIKEDGDAAFSLPPDAPTVAKKRRGRPRNKKPPRNPLGRPRRLKHPDSDSEASPPATATATTAIKRRPGRPRKDQQASQAPTSPDLTPTARAATASPHTQTRSRTPMLATTTMSAGAGAATATATASRGPKRPRVSPPEGTPPAEMSAPTNGIKRGPGRSAKKKRNTAPTMSAPTNGIKIGCWTPEKNMPDAVASAGIKRGPGRPLKKKRAPRMSAQTEGEVRRGPGRPRKEKPAPAMSAQAGGAASAGIKRGPGRPRKEKQTAAMPAQAGDATSMEINIGGVQPETDKPAAAMPAEAGDAASMEINIGAVQPETEKPAAAMPAEGGDATSMEINIGAVQSDTDKPAAAMPAEAEDAASMEINIGAVQPETEKPAAGMPAEAGDAASMEINIGDVQPETEKQTAAMPAEAGDAASMEINIGDVHSETEKPAAAEASRRRKQEEDLASAGKKARTEEGVASGDGKETTRVVDDVCVLISEENAASAAVDAAEPEDAAVDAAEPKYTAYSSLNRMQALSG